MGSLIHEPIKHEVIVYKTAKNETSPNTKEAYAYSVTQYSSALETYNKNILLIPFAINLFSAFYIIFGIARQRSDAQPNQRYREHVQHQFGEYKQLVISPLILVILSSPRVIIALLSECVNISQNHWLYLSPYFISFTPSMLIFIIFVLPSNLYKKHFKHAMKICQRRFRR